MSRRPNDPSQQYEKPSLLFGRRRKEISANLLIPATPSDVWRLVSNPEHIQMWWPRALSGSVTSGEGVGREQLITLSWGSREGRVTQRVTAWEAARRYEWRVIQESVGETLLRPIASSTVTIEIHAERALARVTITGRFEPVGSRGAIAVRQLIRSARPTYRKALRNLDAALSGPLR